ncbi:hypothetical protein V5O48_015260 [Marasmius crinis-equi]|uniref:Uncharacterized protein n=1 Tax=Marasmius crinis-equi TaxID=585013 RepID=A0ABR3EV05_9AGAR
MKTKPYTGADMCDNCSTTSFVTSITPSVDDGYFAFAKIKDEVCLVQVSSLTPITALTTIDIKIFRHEFITIFRLLESRTMHPDDINIIEILDDRLKCYEEEKETVFLAKEAVQRLRKLSLPSRPFYPGYFKPRARAAATIPMRRGYVVTSERRSGRTTILPNSPHETHTATATCEDMRWTVIYISKCSREGLSGTVNLAAKTTKPAQKDMENVEDAAKGPYADSSSQKAADEVELGRESRSRDLDFNEWTSRLGVSCTVEVNGMATGALGPQIFGLGFRNCCIVLVIADIIYFGAILPAAFNVFSMIGFLILSCITGGQLLAAVFSNLNDTLGIVIIALVSLAISFCGYQVLHWFDTYAWIPNLVIYITFLAVGGKNLNLRPEVAAPTAAAIISYGTTAGASCSSWAPMAADYGVYHRADVSGLKLFLYAYFGILLSTFPGHIIGAALAAAAPAVPSWSAGLEDGKNFGNFLAAVLEPVGGFGKFLIVIATLTLPAQSAITMYSFGVSLMSVSRMFTKIPRYAYSVISTAIVIPVSIVGATTFFETFQQIINLIGYWSASYAAIVLVEHFVFRRNTFSNYKVEFWQSASRLPLGFAGVVAFGLSFGLIVPSMEQAWHVGQFAQKGTGDIGLITGFFSAGLFYAILRAVEKRLAPEHDA